MYPWSFAFTDRNGTPLGEVTNPDQRSVMNGISRASTGQVALRSDTRLAAAVRRAGYDVLMKAYYGASLRLNAEVSGYQRTAQSGSDVTVLTAADPAGFRFPKRLLNRTPNVVALNGGAALDRGSLVKSQIDLTASEEGEHGVRTGVQSYTGGSSIVYNMDAFKPLNTFVAEMSTGTNGFEWRLLPIEFTAGKFCDWFAADLLGSAKPNVIFERYRNITQLQEVGDLTTAANTIYHIASGGPNAPGQPIVFNGNADSIARRGVLDSIVQANITDLPLRQQLVSDAAAIQGGWRKVFTFQPAPYDAEHPYRVPQLGRDFDVGDTVRLRARSENPDDPNEMWVDGWVRVWAITHAPDKAGRITTTITVVQSG